MKTKTYFIQTFGCAMNEYDSERIASVAESKGYIPCQNSNEADLIIYNTCSVREKPYVKLSSYLGQARIYKETNKDLIVGITGCIAQQDGNELLKRFKMVDFVVGTDALSRLDTILDAAISGNRVADIEENNSGEYTLAAFSRKKSISANVTIMKGCENFCSYCIVPFVRGKERSRNPKEILDEIKRLADDGVKEVCLLGQNVNSYGKELSDNVDFSDLLAMVAKIPLIKRIRFITSHPKDFSEKMIHTIAEHQKICKYIHLPLQSGSDKILEAMNRNYTCKEYLNKIDYTKKIIPNIAFTSDFITGFPGETEEDFLETIKAVKYVNYDQIFAFNYSVRPKTAAEKLGDTVDYNVKNERLSRLFKVQEELFNERLTNMVNNEVELLVKYKKEDNLYVGSNEAGKSVYFSSEDTINTGEFVKVKITEASRKGIKGSLIV